MVIQESARSILGEALGLGVSFGISQKSPGLPRILMICPLKTLGGKE